MYQNGGGMSAVLRALGAEAYKSAWFGLGQRMGLMAVLVYLKVGVAYGQVLSIAEMFCKLSPPQERASKAVTSASATKHLSQPTSYDCLC